MYKLLLLAAICTLTAQIAPQDKGVFVPHKDGFYEDILRETSPESITDKSAEKTFKADFSGRSIPTIDEFKTPWYSEPCSQGNTGTCWSFSTTSFFESEVYRLTGKKVKLSEVFNVYWEYVEKAKRYVREKGNSQFSEGSEANAVTRLLKDYGAMPEEAFNGMKSGKKFHDHSKLIKEMTAYLEAMKASGEWDEEKAVNEIKSILDKYIGTPPQTFSVDGKEYTPKEYAADYLQVKPDDYVDVLSLKQYPYWKQTVYGVPDNWWYSEDYYNVPLDDFMNAIKSAVRNGYTLSIGGDVSEAGLDGWHDAAIVPTFDIPSEYINEDSRQFRFSNGTTTDDHGIHLIGYTEKDGKDWYLIKDSGAGSRNGSAKGYYFYHEDYVKLKMIDFMVHKDAVKDLLEKFTK